ncbi:transcriptional regulator [Halococcus hamelinensis]|uniref:transcriptional regulator n=1 Tax=Halococcus hamelinensis TaxID=332168 RepID=UPI0009B5C160|nr:transcriptional regulator [Halococcus hamelinensis]
MPERDQDTGRYTAEYSTADFLEAIESLGGAGGTQEIADQVDCIYDTAYKKLRHLEDSGEVKSRKVANARLWSIADE